MAQDAPPDTALEFYAANARAYAAKSSVNRHLDAFLALIRPGGTILELGAGSGQDARRMRAAGFVVDATDGSAELAQEAARLLGQPVRRMLFTELEAEQAYDGVYANAALLHARRAQLPDIIRRIHRALKPGGHVWASFKDGEREGHDGFGRYFNYLNAAELMALWSTGGGWSELRCDSWQGSGYDQAPTRWHAIVARKAS